MINGITFIFRLTLAWFLVYLFCTVTVGATILREVHDLGGLAVAGAFLLCAVVVIHAFSHLRRVRLITGTVDAASLSNRQRRRVEMPFEAGESFDMVDAAIRDLPGASIVNSARDSLQLRARVIGVKPYSASAWPQLEFLRRMDAPRQQILVTVTPNDGAGSVTLVCEPARAAWTDWFLVDDGANLENAEAVVRALTRRVAQRRRDEQASVRQNAHDKELTVAKLNLLHAQIEPHFLYNTLASAQILTRSDPPRADAMLGNLIQYLRHSVPSSDDAISSIGAELERTRAYLDILHIRMGERLTPHIDVPAHLAATTMPAMMLQTLVENAIKHGLEAKPGGGSIWVRASLSADGAAVAVTVADDGRGFSLDGGGTGIGLRNLRERLRLIYGSAAQFSIVANYPSGVAATITVPRGAAVAPAAIAAPAGAAHD